MELARSLHSPRLGSSSGAGIFVIVAIAIPLRYYLRVLPSDEEEEMHGARRIVPALLHQWLGTSFLASAGLRTGLSGSRSRGIHSINQGMIGTTVLCIRKNDTVVIIGDGQVTMGSEILKPNVRKVRRIGENVIGGFAGATADAFTLFERLEAKLEEHPGQLTRAAVELAKAWRTDKFLRRLDALMVVADAEISLTITGNGDVLEPYDGVVGIGSGGSYASAAARALMDLPNMDAETIARKAMKIAADCCIYTNHNFTIEQIKVSPKSPTVADQAATISIPGATTTKGETSSTTKGEDS